MERVADPLARRSSLLATQSQTIAFVVLVVALVVAPFFTYPLFLMECMCFALFALAFNLLIGYVGLLSFGHALYFGWASYMCAHAAKDWGLSPELAILVGDERQLAKAVRNGAEGTICGLSNLVPELLRPMVYEGKDSPVVNALVDEICSYPVLAAVKALTGHVHGDAGYGAMRAPLEALDAAARKRLFAAFDSITQAKAA